MRFGKKRRLEGGCCGGVRMKTLSVYTLGQGEEWDAIVRTFKDYDVYWLSGYVKAFWLYGDGEPRDRKSVV